MTTLDHRAGPPKPLPSNKASSLRRFARDPLAGVWTLVMATGVFAVLLLTVGAIVLADAGDGLQVIGHQTAPEVEATSDLYFRLGDMDAQVANILLVGDGGPGIGTSRTAVLATYEQRRTQADADLQQAAAVQGSGSQAAQAVTSLLDLVGQYEGQVAQIQLIEGQTADLQPGRPPAAALGLYRQATALMRDQILPTAQRLTQANANTMDAAYSSERSSVLTGMVWLIVLGVLVILVLMGLQFLLRRLFHRLLNPALVTATVLAAVVLIGGAVLASDEADHLKVAKADAFDSVLALSQARAVSYDANADESRYLVDPADASQFRHAFAEKSQQLVGLSSVGVDDINDYDSALASALNTYQSDGTVTFDGFFGTEMRNITFPGEQAAAEQTLTAYQRYELDDRRLRSLADSGDLAAAIAFDTGQAKGQSDADFAQYDAALESVITINQSAFDQSIHAGEQELDWKQPAAIIVTLLIIGLTAIGVRPRLAEYR